MFKAIEKGKIIGINETGDFPLMNYESLEEDIEHQLSDYIHYDGEFLLKSDIPAPTQEEQEAKRAQEYLVEVDPITAHIQRLRDEAEPDEEKIAELIQERAEKVQEIKDRYPYPVEE